MMGQFEYGMIYVASASGRALISLVIEISF